jgi:DNA-directed RNA polymerase specialized sigma24 family protein
MLRPDRETRFRAIYADAYGDVLRFAERRVHPSHAEDATADAFVVAWQRLDDAPSSCLRRGTGNAPSLNLAGLRRRR